MTTSDGRGIAAALLAGAVLFGSAPALAQPSLTPPGPPVAPSGRMGVRTEITALPYVVAASGSYYVSQTLIQVGPAPGIMISASNVTIDLMGFGLLGAGFPGSDGITIAPGAFSNVTIHDGYVMGWGGTGLNLAGAPGPVSNVHVFNVMAAGNFTDGISVGPQSIVREVIASNNTGVGIRLDRVSKLTNGIAAANGSTGIVAGAECHISDSVAANNGAQGIMLGMSSVLIGSVTNENAMNGVVMVVSCRVTDCVASMNGFGGGFGSGFNDGGGGANILGGCAAYNNFDSGFASFPAAGAPATSAHDCIASFNGFGSGLGDGFENLRSVSGCTANGNADNGIETFYGGHVYRNTCEGNGGNGIAAFSDGNVIEQNNVVGNGLVGIDTTFNPGPGGNLFTGNRAHANGAGTYAFIIGVDTYGAIFAGPGIIAAGGAMLNVSY